MSKNKANQEPALPEPEIVPRPITVGEVEAALYQQCANGFTVRANGSVEVSLETGVSFFPHYRAGLEFLKGTPRHRKQMLADQLKQKELLAVDTAISELDGRREKILRG